MLDLKETVNKKFTTYKCQACGSPAYCHEVTKEMVRSCECKDAPIVAEISATCAGIGGTVIK